MKRYIWTALCLMLAGLSVGYAQNITNLPQVAKGAFPGGSFQTTIIIVNSGTAPASVTIRVTADDGSVVADFFTGVGVAPVVVPAGNSRVFLAEGTEPLTAGAASVTSDNPVGATVIFSQYDAADNLLTEAGVTGAPSSSGFTIPVDVSAGFNTGIAFFKPGAGAATVTVRINDLTGAPRGQTTIELVGNGHRAIFVTELFPSLTGFMQGSLTVTSTAAVAAVALRTGSGAVPVITTLPVAAAGTSFTFPQAANGAFPGGSFRTTIIIINSGTAAATFTIQLTQDDGSPLTMPGIDTGMVTLAPGNTRVFQSSGTGGLNAGAAVITSNNPIVVAVIFSQFDGAGNLVTEAGVSNSPAQPNFSIPVDLRPGFNTGVALFKPGAGSANLTLRIYDLNANLRGQLPLVLGPNGHRAAFVPELFPSLTGLTQGVLSIAGGGANTAAVALRTGAGAVPVLTTLPVVTGAFTGGGTGGDVLTGSFDGEFTLEGASMRGGTLTLSLREDGSRMVGGRVGQEFDDGGCIRASEFTPVARTASGFTAMAPSLDGSPAINNLTITGISGSGEDLTLTGEFTTRGCGMANVRGRFTLRKARGQCAPSGPFLYTGGVWNIEGSPGQERSNIERLQGQIQGRNFTVTVIRVSTVVGAITGTAQGELNEACDRVQNLVITLDTVVGPVTLRGEISITSDGSVIFGALRTGPLDPISLAGSLLARRQ